LKVRNIAGFNRKVLDALATGRGIWPTRSGSRRTRGSAETKSPVLQPLPFIVVVVDELADMMMIVGKKVEELIARLSRRRRAPPAFT
jgi:S-DNA-T family DNA segregation ATPase FtsK/SpoIIIE